MANRRKERLAHNESAFRALNESLEASVHRGRPEVELAGFVCECGDPRCEATVRLELAAYESIRQDSQLFFVVPGHEAPDAEDVVEDRDGYRVVRKHDDVAHIAERGDRRRTRE
ncbi:MAG: hypothetical protein ACRDLN_01045 [Solirubrobacteraceae bacterium]